MRDWIKRIIETLQYLRVTDRDKAVFGSWHHGYRLDSPLSHDDIRKLEETYELSLPEDYPFTVRYYGLMTILAGDGPVGPRAPSRPFPLFAPFQEMTEEMWTLGEKDWSEEMRAEYQERQRLWRELDFNAGSLLLADYGCGITTSVVTNGPFRGQVWLLDPNVNRWIPFGMASNIHYADEDEPGDDRESVYMFRDWYEHWLRSSVEGFEGKS